MEAKDYMIRLFLSQQGNNGWGRIRTELERYGLGTLTPARSRAVA